MLGLLLTSNPVLTATAFAVLAALVVLLWQPGAPLILLFVAGMFWLQAATKVLHADLLGVPVTGMSLNPATIDEAVLLSLLSTLVVAVGMRAGAGRPRSDAWGRLAADAAGLSLGRLGAMTAAVWVVSSLAGFLAFSPARQLVLAAANLKLAFLFALACAVFLRRRGYGLLGIIVFAELVVGFTGFFSGFKDVLFLLLIAVLAARPHVPLRRLPTLLAGAAAIVGLGLVWTAIKPEFRTFLNAGTGEQVVLRGPAERIRGFVDQLGALETGELASASEELAERLAYVDFFAIVLDRVPRTLPHEDGALLGSAVRHILTPRLLFPNKPPLPSDSEMTNKYTGLGVASGKQGTSVNLGFPAEAYIDFGPLVMFLPMFGIGLACGLVYRGLVAGGGDDRRGLALSYGLAVAALIQIPGAGTILKLVGALLTNFVVLFAIKKALVLPATRMLYRDGGGGAPPPVVP